MKIIITHTSPDMDAITSVWLIKKFLPNWNDASVKFVPAGERLGRGPAASFPPVSARSISEESSAGELRAVGSPSSGVTPQDAIEEIGEDEVIHVDTGLGPLDHHQTASDQVCGASLAWDYVKANNSEFKVENDRIKSRIEAISRMVKVVVDIDHFKEVFRKDPLADYHEFDLAGILEGLKLQLPNQDDYYCEFAIKCLDAVLHTFENRIWAEREIAKNGHEFETRFGKGIGFKSINDSVIKLSQKMGYAIVVRKDPRKGYVRVKARPSQIKNDNIDLTLVYEKLKKMDPDATWYLHISKKMLLNGSVKNPKMRPTKLTLDEIIKVLEKI